MDRKMLFFDIDGTLLPHRPLPVPESAVRGLQAARKKGHLVFVNTGRTPYELPKELEVFEFDGYICGCGTNLFYHGENLFSSHLPHVFCMELIRKTREYRVPTCFEGRDMVYFDETLPGYPQLEEIRRYLNGSYLSALSGPQWDSLVFDKTTSYLMENPHRQDFLNFCSEYCYPIDRGGGEWELIQKDYSKATGMQFFMDRFGISREDCFAFGDSTNDLPMLQAAGTSIAMGDSSPEILPFCAYQTAGILEDGILQALEHFRFV